MIKPDLRSMPQLEETPGLSGDALLFADDSALEQ